MSRTMRSAGLLPYRTEPFEVLIAHPGGPFFRGRQKGAWSLIKGMVKDDETDADAAVREFEEETGWAPNEEGWISLGEVTMRSRKVVVAWALSQEFDLATFNPGTFTMHGREYPEIDAVEWTEPEQAKELLNPAMAEFIDRLQDHLRENGGTEGAGK